MKKAFATFPIALFFVLTLFALAIAQQNSLSAALYSSGEVLVLEKKHYSDVGLKKAFSQVFSLSEGFDERQSSENIAANLAAMEDFAESHFEKQGVQIVLWFGSLDSFEEKSVLRQTLSLGKPMLCSHCYSFKTMTVDWEGKPVHKSIELIFDRRISKNGFVHTPSSSEWVGEEIAFGATFFMPNGNTAWVSVMREGFG